MREAGEGALIWIRRTGLRRRPPCTSASRQGGRTVDGKGAFVQSALRQGRMHSCLPERSQIEREGPPRRSAL